MCLAGNASPTSVTLAAAGGSTVSWTCQGTAGGTNATCTATRIAGTGCGPGTTPPTTYPYTGSVSSTVDIYNLDLCIAGTTPSGAAVKLTGTGGYYVTLSSVAGTTVSWNCNAGGGASVSCTAKRATNGACGEAQATYLYTGSSTIISSNMCLAGNASPTSVTLAAAGGSTVSWTCQGTAGGTNATCTATRAAPVYAACGSAATNYPFDGLQTIISSNMCSPGSPNPTSVTLAAARNSTIIWTCKGAGGGTDANNCTAKRLDKPPTATNLSYSEWYCSNSLLFQWNYYTEAANNPETKFDFQIDNNSDFSSPAVDTRVCGVSSQVNRQQISVNISYPLSTIKTYCSGADTYASNTPDSLIYNTTYYWRVKVYDTQGTQGFPSDWIPGLPFTTATHAWPKPDFTTPASAQLVSGRAISFTDTSQCYGPGITNNLCKTDTTGKVKYTWSFGDGGTATTKGGASHIYTAAGTYILTLNICDDAGCCSTNQNVKILPPGELPKPPQWREISPF
jgi:hypothetical protein